MPDADREALKRSVAVDRAMDDMPLFGGWSPGVLTAIQDGARYVGEAVWDAARREAQAERDQWKADLETAREVKHFWREAADRRETQLNTVLERYKQAEAERDQLRTSLRELLSSGPGADDLALALMMGSTGLSEGLEAQVERYRAARREARRALGEEVPS